MQLTCGGNDVVVEISCRYWIVMCICFISAFLLPRFYCFYCFYYFTYVLWTFLSEI